MSLDELSNFIRKHLGACITSLFIFSAFGAFLIKQYMDLYEKKNQLDQQVKEFYKDNLAKEHEFLKREKEIYRQEISMESKKEAFERKITELEGFKIKYEKLNLDLKESTRNSSVAMRRKIAEDKLSNLMSEFSEMGVNLRRTPECGDKDAWKQYNMAEAKLSEAMTFARANGLYEYYQGFFNANSSFMIKVC